MDTLTRHLRFALRTALRNPAFTFVAVFALALGIGSVTAIYSVINGTIVRGLPFEDADNLYFLNRYDRERQPWNTAIPILDFEDIAERANSFEALTAWFTGTVNVSDGGHPVRFNGSRMDHHWLKVLRARPLMGRAFTAEDDQRGVAPTMLLSHATWLNHFEGDPAVIGRAVRINGRMGEIIGVMPPDFAFPGNDEVWIPLRPSLDWSTIRRGSWSISVVGRLADGVSREQAEAELTSLIQALALEYPDTHGEYQSGGLVPIARQMLGEQTVQMLYIMFAMALFVLLIACANVANLLLARSTRRTKELAIRSALGASRRSLVYQMLVESTVLAVFGALGGLALGAWAARLLYAHASATGMPAWMRFDVDFRVLGVVAVVTLLAGVVAGMVPALRASRASVAEILKDDTRTGSSLRMGLFSKGLVVMQVAISCVLLILTVLMTRTVQNVAGTDLHFDTGGVLTARMGLFEGDYPDAEARNQFFMTLRRNLAERPEVRSVALYGRYRWINTGLDWTRVGNETDTYAQFEDYVLTTSERVTPDYFSTLGVALLAGREFNDLDTPDNLPVAVVNEAFAAALFPNEDPIGRRFQRQPWPQERANASDPSQMDFPWLTIVGVAPNMAAQGVGNTTGAEGRHYWEPLAPANTPAFMTVAVTGFGDPLRLADVVREEVTRLDANLPVYSVATPAMMIEEDTATLRLAANIFKTFGFVAVFLASVGIYGIMAFAVNQRTQEFGIRAALGASPRSLLFLVLRFGYTQFFIGLGFGLVGAWFFSKLLRNFLYGVSPQDPLTYALVAVAFSLVAAAACLPAAIRAARIDPAHALRYE